MKFRSLLLAGAVFPFALSVPTFALEIASEPPVILAQSEPPCPEGFDCAPVGEAPATEEQPAAEPEQTLEAPVEEQPAAEQPAAERPVLEEPAAEPAPVEEAPAEVLEAPAAAEEPAAEEPAAAEQPAEEPTTRQRNRRERAAERERRRQQEQDAGTAEPSNTVEEPAATAEEPAAEQPAVEEPTAEQPTADQPTADQPTADQPAADQPAAGQGTRRERALERARRRQQELEQQGQGVTPDAAPTLEQPAGQAGEPAAGDPAAGVTEPVPSTEPALIEPGTPQPDGTQPDAAGGGLEDPSVVEQQLEAQGDEQEADQVRELRRKLRREREEAGADTFGEPTDSGTVDSAPGDAATPDEGLDEDGEPRDRADRERRDRDRADRRDRRNRDREDRGRGRVVEERGDRIIIDLGGGNLYVEPRYESDRFLYNARDVQVEELPGGETRTIVFRENGSQIITVTSPYGDIITRTRVTPNGREVVLIDNRIPVEVVGSPPPVLFEPSELPPLVVEIPREQYIVDLGQASRQDIETALLAPPVQQLERTYTLEQVTRNEELRAYVPRIDLDTITFALGSATIGNDQMQALTNLGQAMESVISENPDEVYLIEGHTDAVGSDYDNLILSDQRAETVAVALSQNFDIPPENLVTEGYGEQYLKVETEAASRENRRVTVRRITPLLTAEQQQ